MILALLYVIWSNYQDIQLMKQYHKEINKQGQKQGTCNSLDCHVYPWWHGGFPHGGFRVGPWNWNRSQHYYHPKLGWYASHYPM